jgi:hypothetical protein
MPAWPRGRVHPGLEDGAATGEADDGAWGVRSPALCAREAFQFDWGEDWATIGGRRVKLQVAHTKLSYSRAFILRAYPLQTHEMLFDALGEAFRVLGGVPRRGIFDNMKTAVDRVGPGKRARQVNLRFSAMVSHYLFEAEFCNPAAGWEKGKSRRPSRTRGGRSGRRCRIFPICPR